MLKKIGISAFLLVVTISQAFAADHGHAADPHEQATHAVADHGPDMAHGVEHASGGLPQLDPVNFSSQFFWLIIVFTFMFIFFSKKTVPQISHTIENRTERITSDLDSAERLKNEVAELQTSYEEKLSQAREESFTVFVSTEKTMKEETERRTAQFQERSREKVEELEKNIEDAVSSAMNEMSDVAAEVANQASEKIIGVKADAKSAKAIVKSLTKAA